MARPLRIQYPGAWYHVTSRGNEKKAIFRGKGDRERFLSYLESAHGRYGNLIHAYCLMNNHYHLLIETPRSNLSQTLHHINGAYTSYFNAKRKRSGHLFQGRYRAILVEKDAYCKALSRYIHLNPVRADLADGPAGYPWSSYQYYMGKGHKPAWLTTGVVLGYFGNDAARHYREYVEGPHESKDESPLENVLASTFLGSINFAAWAKETWKGFKDSDLRNLPALKELSDRPSLEDIEKAVESVTGKNHPQHKKFCIYASQQLGGFTLKKIGAYYHMREAAVSQSNRRFGKDLSEHRPLKRLFAEIKVQIGMDVL